MIVLNYMRWSNFFRYSRDNYLNLSNENVRQLIAGNGAGKTSILLILEEILYGKNHKGVKKADLLNRSVSSKELSGEVGFTKDGIIFVVKLSRSPGLKVSLTSNGVDISDHTGAKTMKQIEQVLGMPYTLFNQLVYLSTDSKLNFLTDTDTERKKFLVRLFKLDKYLQAHDKFKLTVKNIDGDVKQTLGSTSTLSTLINRDTKIADRAVEKELPLPNGFESKRRTSLESDLSNIRQINAKVEKNNSYKKMLNSLDKTMLGEHIEPPSTKELTEKGAEAGGLKAKIANNKSRIAKIDKLGDKCPTCFNTVDKDGINNLKLQSASRIDQLEKELLALNEVIAQDTYNSNKYRRQQDVVNEFERLTNVIDDELKEDLLDKSKIESELRDIRQKINIRDKEIEGIKSLNSKTVEANFAIKAAISNISNYREELKQKEAELEKLQKSLGTATTLRDIFSTKGLISYKLQFLVLDLEKQINTYLAELSKGRFLINFALSGDKLNVVIIDNGKEIEISALSTGELSIVEISTLLAVRKLMCSISGTTINILFLDEVISVLEDNNKEVVLELLVKQEQDLNILVVSHGYEHPLIPKIAIRKVDGISKLGDF